LALSLTTTSVINERAFIELMKAQLNKSMLEAAEPLIKDALVRMEQAMRKDLAANLIAFIDREFQFNVMQNRIVIEIRRGDRS
jgi:hypothetical protein